MFVFEGDIETITFEDAEYRLSRVMLGMPLCRVRCA